MNSQIFSKIKLNKIIFVISRSCFCSIKTEKVLDFILLVQVYFLFSKACLLKSVHHFLRFPIGADLRLGLRSQYDPHWLSSSDNIRAPPHSDGALINVPSLQPRTSPDGQSRPIEDASLIFELFELSNCKFSVYDCRYKKKTNFITST